MWHMGSHHELLDGPLRRSSDCSSSLFDFPLPSLSRSDVTICSAIGSHPDVLSDFISSDVVRCFSHRELLHWIDGVQPGAAANRQPALARGSAIAELHRWTLTNMSSTKFRVVIIAVAAALFLGITLVILQTPTHLRMKALLLIVATTVLTCSSVAGYAFLKIFLGHALSFGIAPRPTWTGRLRFLFLAIVAFGISFGSGALLSYFLSRV